MPRKRVLRRPTIIMNFAHYSKKKTLKTYIQQVSFIFANPYVSTFLKTFFEIVMYKSLTPL